MQINVTIQIFHLVTNHFFVLDDLRKPPKNALMFCSFNQIKCEKAHTFGGIVCCHCPLLSAALNSLWLGEKS